jgi:hypothetical protein
MTRRSRWISVGAILLAAATLPHCTEPDPVQGFFVLISNSWQDVTNPDHVFNLQSADDNKTEGSFTGQEFVDANDFTGFELSGSWADNRIQFDVQRDTGTVRYSGSITSDRPTELSFSSSAGPLRIRRGQ